MYLEKHVLIEECALAEDVGCQWYLGVVDFGPNLICVCWEGGYAALEHGDEAIEVLAFCCRLAPQLAPHAALMNRASALARLGCAEG